jgi:predicted nucleic acid-binding protein
VLLDTNVFINVLAGRGPAVLSELVAALSRVFISAPTRAELAWVLGRLDPDHPNTARVVMAYRAVLSRIDPVKVLVPTDADWLAAGELAGSAARSIAGGGGKVATAFDRVELISDALTAVLARQAGVTVVTEDKDFDVLAEHLPDLKVLFYARDR